MTLLESIKEFVDNISLSDRQEDTVSASYDNLKKHLKCTSNKANNLAVIEVFQNGSYMRDTIIRPGFDVDVYAVINQREYGDNTYQRPNPQTVLTRFKKYLNALSDYEDKCTQSRPCITIELLKHSFDVMPAICEEGAYLIPNENLTEWNFSDPFTHNSLLDKVQKLRGYKVKNVIKAVKRWKNDNCDRLPSFHVEEIAINIFNLFNFTNLRQGIELWFDYAENYLRSELFNSFAQYEAARDKIHSAKKKLDDAKDLKDNEAQKVWKDLFGKDFPVVDEEEARSFSDSLVNGTLRYGTTGLSTSVGSRVIAASKGFYGDVLEEK